LYNIDIARIANIPGRAWFSVPPGTAIFARSYDDSHSGPPSGAALSVSPLKACCRKSVLIAVEQSSRPQALASHRCQLYHTGKLAPLRPGFF
jgi:hypothetical protein